MSDHYIRRERADSYIHPTHYTQLAALNDSRVWCTSCLSNVCKTVVIMFLPIN